MVDSKKNPNLICSDLKSLISLPKTRRTTKLFAYGFIFAFMVCTAFLAFNPSNNTSSPWFYNFFSSSSASSFKASMSPYKSQVSSLLSHFFPNTSSEAGGIDKEGDGSSKDEILGSGSMQNGALRENQTQVGVGSSQGEILGSGLGTKGGLRENQTQTQGVLVKNETVSGSRSKEDGVLKSKNQTNSGIGSQGIGSSIKNQTLSANGSKEGGVLEEKVKKNDAGSENNGVLESKNQTNSGIGSQGIGTSIKNQTLSANGSKESGVSKEKQAKNGFDIKKGAVLESKNKTDSGNGASAKNQTATNGFPLKSNLTGSLVKGDGSARSSSGEDGKKKEKWIEDMIGCDLFHGNWVKDESYPMYPEGSCPHIDEPFNCYLNGRPDRSYQKLRWQPSGCNIPRLNARDMLERLRGKRLVFVGDSLNRNMWESLVCVLRNSLKDKTKVFEASGRHEFRTEHSYSFLFKDFGATVEFFRSPFLVQEWEMHQGNETKETLRLDIIESSASKYKDAHVIIFNTGHWWTHEKTSKGKDYYQEGNRVYGELNVVEAFHKALNTWARWVDANVDSKKSLVLFRGYSASHFSGGQWNSGGACDKETKPIVDDKYLRPYPPKMNVLETVIKRMKTPVSYLNITGMTDYRKDAHPSVYRKQNLTEEERIDPLRFQDCSHWCLPGVPDSWNEILYAQLIMKQYQMAQ